MVDASFDSSNAASFAEHPFFVTGKTLMITVNVNSGDEKLLNDLWKGIDLEKLAKVDKK